MRRFLRRWIVPVLLACAAAGRRPPTSDESKDLHPYKGSGNAPPVAARPAGPQRRQARKAGRPRWPTPSPCCPPSSSCASFACRAARRSHRLPVDPPPGTPPWRNIMSAADPLDPVSLSRRIIDGGELTRDEARDLFSLQGEALYDLFYAAHKVRRHFHGNRVTFCSILPTKFGNCSEDCKFCAQSAHFDTGITAARDDGRRRGGQGLHRRPRPRRQRLRHRQQRPRADQARMAEDHGSRPRHEGSGRHLPLRHAGHAERGAGPRPERGRRPPHQSQPGNLDASSIRRSSRRTPGRSAWTRCGWRSRSAWRRAAAASSAWARPSRTA